MLLGLCFGISAEIIFLLEMKKVQEIRWNGHFALIYHSVLSTALHLIPAATISVALSKMKENMQPLN